MCKIVKGVRKVPSHRFEMRQGFFQHTLALAYLPHSLMLTQETFLTS